MPSTVQPVRFLARGQRGDDDVQDAGFPGSRDTADKDVPARDQYLDGPAVFGQADVDQLGYGRDRRAGPGDRRGVLSMTRNGTREIPPPPPDWPLPKTHDGG